MNKMNKILSFVMSSAMLVSSFGVVPAGAINIGDVNDPNKESEVRLINESSSDITLSGTEFIHNNQEIKPSVVFKYKIDGEVITLKEGIDYSIDYYENTDVGVGTVTLSGIYDSKKIISYSGSISRYFKINHNYDEGKVTKEPNENELGEKTFTCKVCGDTYTQKIGKTGHNYTETITTKATCQKTGLKTFKCTDCDDEYTETIPKTDHTYSSIWKVTKRASCSAEGSKHHYCTVCNAKKDVISIPKVAHTYKLMSTQKPTCEFMGANNYRCIVCSDEKTEFIPTTSHNYIGEVTKKPTCTAEGVKTYTCSGCWDSYTETIKATGHKFGSWSTTKKATCKATGTQTRKCSGCGKTETKTIAKTAHSYKSVTVNSTYFAKGYTGKKCSVCGTITDKKYKSLLTMSAPKASSNSTSSIKLSWSKVSGAKGYEVYQNGKKIKTTTGTSYTVSKLKAGTTYKYTIKPYTKSGTKTTYGNQSKTLTTKTKAKAVSLKVTAETKKATLKWGKVTGATNYKVYYKTSSKGKWKLLKTASNKTTSYTKTKLSSKKTYWFKVDTVRTVSGKTYTSTGSTKSAKIK